jgi:hypothetical protein
MTLPDTTHSRDYILLKGRVGEDYARELVVESAIDPAVALELGYWGRRMQSLNHRTSYATRTAVCPPERLGHGIGAQLPSRELGLLDVPPSRTPRSPGY